MISPQWELNALNEISKPLIAWRRSLDTYTFPEPVLIKIVSMMNADLGAISLLGEDLTMSSVAIHGVKDLSDPTWLNETVAKAVVESGHSLIITDAFSAEVPDSVVKGVYQEGFRAFICTPLKVDQRIIGVIALGWRTVQEFEQYHLTFIETAGDMLGVCFHNAQLITAHQTNEVELRRVCKAAIEAQEAERKRLARELHDEVGQAITAILLRLKAMQDETDLELIKDRLNGLRYLTGQTLEEVRRLSMDLRPTVLDDLGLVSAIRWYVDECSSRTGLKVNFLLRNITERLPEEVEIVLYRAVQEGLTNIIRHAEAKHVQIELELQRNTVLLTICDDGKGMKLSSEYNGLGLIGMQERVKLIGGQHNINSQPGQGVMISITLPI
ncbi:GAF domain-containing sensor histidine kinase [Desulfitobacterium hafniense]|uniref:GAF domain-containing sensor histidine kinase n=1 Tax=Desulfitobacterium hafniense TaxID=49338 RepID=UPI0003693699|nr:GAF domain-containing sensor histidine kinase [Desulfitobacterium hafniense]